LNRRKHKKKIKKLKSTRHNL